MKLPALSFLEKKEKPEFFLALILRNEKANAVILEQVERKLRIVSQFEESFEDSVETATTEEFLNVLDKAISGAEDALPPNIETQKTIFGLKGSWVEDNKIKKEYFDKLKKACHELALTPIGFLVLNEAIISLIQKEEGAPITAILTEIGKKHVTVSWVKAGKILESKSSEIHQTASYTIDTLLKHFESPEIMPSRIILFDAQENLSQELIGHQWSKSLPFLHLPQIVNLNLNFDAGAMLFGAAAQMGFGVIQGFSQKPKDEEIPQMTPEEFNAGPIEPPTHREEVLTETIAEESVPSENKIEQLDDAVSSEFFGFVTDEDIAKTTPAPEQKKEEEKTQEEKVQENVEHPKSENISEEIEQIPEKIFLTEEEGQPIPNKVMLVFPKVILVLKKILGLGKKIPLKKPNVPFTLPAILGAGKGKLIFIPIFLVIIVVLVLFYSFFGGSATVTLNVSPDVSEKSQTVTFSVSNPTDVKNNVIAAEFTSVSEDGTSSTPATGKQDVGDKAKGTVTVFNNSSDSVSLSSGAKITSSNGLVFTLNNAVSIASASGDPFSGTKPSTATVNVTASTFGTDYNLPSGTKFSIGDNAAIAAKNDNAFSGGTKKEITVISKDDIAKLLTDLPKNLEDKAKSDISSKLASDKALLPAFASESVDKKNFDKNVGDQASQVTLTGTVTYQGISYAKNDLVSLAANLFNSQNITINKDNLNVNVKDTKTKTNKDVDANLDIQAILLPKIDNAALAKQIAGQSVTKAKTELSSISRVSSVIISISPNIPLLPKSLPRNSKNIKIIIKLNG